LLWIVARRLLTSKLLFPLTVASDLKITWLASLTEVELHAVFPTDLTDPGAPYKAMSLQDIFSEKKT
jgi:hypothetical protein